jgi:glycosyltransferase involved in cell wall biosynthesis
MIDILKRLPNVTYRGQVTPEEAMKVISESSLLLSTSDEEGFPNTFLEAWSTGTPVISLRIDPEGIIQRLGLGVVSRTVEAAVAATSYFLESIDRRDDAGQRAQRYVKEAHIPEVVLKAFESVIQGNSC